MRLPLIPILCALLMSGCTAIKASIHIAEAEQALGEAREFGAPELAVYEYTMAVRYLEKAREEIGWSDYRVSENLSKRSMEWSDKSIIAIERGNRGLEGLGEELADELDFGGTPEPAPIDDEFEDLGGEEWLEPSEPIEPLPEPEPEPEPEPSDEPDPGDEWEDDFDDLDDFELEE